MKKRRAFMCAMLLWCVAGAAAAQTLSGPALLDRIKQGGVVLMMRHAQTTPGTGDPAGFTLADCATQRNLSAEGKAQAKRVGAALKAAGVRPAVVLSSAWCRCRDTARLMFGNFAVNDNLNSFFEDRAAEPRQTAALRTRLAALAPGAPPEVWVTHQVNITALTGAVPAMGEIVVLGAGGSPVIGRLSL
jgi:phosphohistidine phosphatase SixA